MMLHESTGKNMINGNYRVIQDVDKHNPKIMEPPGVKVAESKVEAKKAETDGIIVMAILTIVFVIISGIIWMIMERNDQQKKSRKAQYAIQNATPYDSRQYESDKVDRGSFASNSKLIPKHDRYHSNTGLIKR